MTGIKLQKRDKDFFVSYGHGDHIRMAPLIALLKGVCGLQIWLDSIDGNAAERSSELLASAIGNSRGALFCLSEAWTKSTWCKNEHEIALSEQRMYDGFEIVRLRLDDAEPPGWFNAAEIIDLRETDPQSIARLLRSLSSDVPHRFDNAEDVYLAAPWTKQSELVGEALRTVRKIGWRLIGDSPNLKHLGEKRIEAIQRTTRGVVAVLPHDPSQPETTSRYILEEVRLALDLKKPLLLLAEPGVVPPDYLLQGALRPMIVTLKSGPEGRADLTEKLEAFEETLRHVAHDDTGAFIFFASSLRGDPTEADNIASVIERSSNMRCVRGEQLAGDNVQKEIIDKSSAQRW